MSVARPGAGAVAAVLVSGIGWGLLAPASKVLFAAEPATFNGITVAAARATWSLPFFLIALGAAWRLERPSLDLRRVLVLALAGITFGPVNIMLFSVAAEHTSIAHITFFVGATPLINAVAAALAFRAPLDTRGRFALVMGIAGVGLVASARSGVGAELLGDLLMTGWLIAFAVYAIALRVGSRGLSSAFAMFFAGTIGMAALAVPLVAFGAGGAIAHVYDTPAIALAFFGELVVLGSIIAPTTFAAAIRRMGVAVATIGAEYTALAVGVLSSVLALESWKPATIAGGLCLVAALGVTFVPTRLLRRRPHEVSP